jgi:hypothetical protein
MSTAAQLDRNQRQIAPIGGIIAQVVAPILIMLLVGSLLFFFIEVFYHGGYQARVLWIFGLFVMAAVLISRISIEMGSARAYVYGLALGFATLMVTSVLFQFEGVSIGASFLINLMLIAFVWWSASRLTWDCTLVDGSRDTSAQGLIELIRRNVTHPDRGEEVANSHSSQQASDSTPSDTAKSFNLIAFLFGKSKNSPGLWVIYFSAAALPIFGFGQTFIPVSDSGSRQFAFMMFVIYMMSALGLLMTTSLLTLSRYVMSKRTVMPLPVFGSWLVFGGVCAVIVLAVCWLIPRPAPEYSVAQNLIGWSTPNRDPSKFAVGNDGKKTSEDVPANSTVTNDSAQQSSSQGNSKSGSAGQKSGGNQSGGKSGKNSSGSSKQNNQSSNNSDQRSSNNKSDSSQQQKNGSSGDKNNSSGEQSNSDTNSKNPDSENRSDQPNENSQSNSDASEKDKSEQNDGSSNDQKSSSSNNSSSARRSSQSQSSSQSARSSNSAKPNNFASPQSASNAGTNLISGIFSMMKYIMIFLIIAVLIILAIVYRDQLVASLKSFWQQLLNLFAGKKRDTEVEGLATAAGRSSIRLPSFSEFSNPFNNGNAQKWPANKVTHYTFAALEAWGRDHSVAREPDQTAMQFANNLTTRFQQAGDTIDDSIALYCRVSYAAYQPAATDLVTLENLWRFLKQSAGDPSNVATA